VSGLVLKLTPRERILVNGAVIENGDRRSKISILTPNASILRLKDAIKPEEAKTPVRRVCYIAQLVLSGDAELDSATIQLSTGIEQLCQVFDDPTSKRSLANAKIALAEHDFYKVLKFLRSLFVLEDSLIASVNP